MLQLTALRPSLPPSRCDTAGLARRACSGEADLLRGGELGRSRRPPCGCSSRTSRVQRQVWWWISLSPHHPAQVRCCEVNSVARDGRTGARRVTSRESGLLVPRTRTCTCVDVRAHARGVVCGLGPGRDVAGGRPARDARASGRVRAHRGRGRAPRRTRNPAPALLPLPRARSAPACARRARAVLSRGFSLARPPGSVLRTDTTTRRAVSAFFDRSTPLESLDSLLSYPSPRALHKTMDGPGEIVTGTLRVPSRLRSIVPSGDGHTTHRPRQGG